MNLGVENFDFRWMSEIEQLSLQKFVHGRRKTKIQQNY